MRKRQTVNSFYLVPALQYVLGITHDFSIDMEKHFARKAFEIATEGNEQKRLSILETQQLLKQLGLEVSQDKWTALKG